MTAPLVGDADATDEFDTTVDDHQLAMGPVVHGREGGPARRVVASNFATRIAHALQMFVVEASADPVEQNFHGDAAARGLGECVGKLVADRTGPVDVGLQRDGCARVSHRVQHGRKDLVAIQQRGDAISRNESRRDHQRHGSHELGFADRIVLRQGRVDLLVTQGEVQPYQDQEPDREQTARHKHPTHMESARVDSRRFARNWIRSPESRLRGKSALRNDVLQPKRSVHPFVDRRGDAALSSADNALPGEDLLPERCREHQFHQMPIGIAQKQLHPSCRNG